MVSGSESVPRSHSDLCPEELMMKNIDYVLNRSMVNHQSTMVQLLSMRDLFFYF